MRANQQGHDFIRQTFNLIHSLVHQVRLVSQYPTHPLSGHVGRREATSSSPVLHPLVQATLYLFLERMIVV